MIKRYFWLIFIFLPVFVLGACAPVTPAAQVVIPTPAEGFYSLATRTGIAEVDTVLDAVASGDIQRLRSLIQFRTTKCTQDVGLGGPPKCREGEVVGTPVEVLPFLGSEGYFFYKDEIEKWPGVQADGLYAVYEVSPEFVSDPEYPSGKYAVMLVNNKDASVISLRVDSGNIVRVDYILDNSPEVVTGWIQREASKMILAPAK